jgi:hypothetical protein
LLPGLNPFHRPAGVLSNQWFGIPSRFFQSGQGASLTDVAQRHANISQQAAPFRAQNRRAGKTGFETGLVQLQ